MFSLDNIIDFYETYSVLDEKPKREVIEDIIKKHFNYNTILVLRDNNGISALVRWNKNGNTAHILDCMIRTDKRRYTFIKSLMRFGMNKFNTINKLVWERSKYPERKQKEYNGF